MIYSRAELIADSRELPEEEYEEEEEEPKEIYTTELPGIEVIDTRALAKRKRGFAPSSRFVGLFVMPKELKESGTLTNSAYDKMLLTTLDEVLITSPEENQPKRGDRYMLYRTLGSVVHPKKRKRWGYMTQVTGLVSILSVEEKVVRARIDKSFVEISVNSAISTL